MSVMSGVDEVQRNKLWIDCNESELFQSIVGSHRQFNQSSPTNWWTTAIAINGLAASLITIHSFFIELYNLTRSPLNDVMTRCLCTQYIWDYATPLWMHFLNWTPSVQHKIWTRVSYVFSFLRSPGAAPLVTVFNCSHIIAWSGDGAFAAINRRRFTMCCDQLTEQCADLFLSLRIIVPFRFCCPAVVHFGGTLTACNLYK